MIQHKKAALIGAGEESLHTIEKAQELGVFVTALDGNPKAAGLQAADEGLAVDISREDEVIKALQEETPDFVITGPIGRYLTTAGAVNDAFQLRGINRQSAVWCTDKYLFHEKLHAAGLRDCHCERVPAFCGKDAAGVWQIVDKLMKKAEEEFSFPAILKPRYGSGSRGIFFLNSCGRRLRSSPERTVRRMLASRLPAKRIMCWKKPYPARNTAWMLLWTKKNTARFCFGESC